MTLIVGRFLTQPVTVEDPQPRGRLRRVERADLLAIVHIEKRTFDRPWNLSTFETFLDAPGFLVLEDPETEEFDAGIAGYVVSETIDVRGDRFGHVKDLAVKPALQGNGRGQTLVDGVLSVLAGYGATRVRLEVRPSNDRARSLYKSAGFEILARYENYYPDGEDALLMARSLLDGT